MIRVYIALGSNLAMPLQQVSAAREALAHLPRSRLVACSPLYRTKPLGPQDQPDFLKCRGRTGYIVATRAVAGSHTSD